jgi:N-acetylneuraminic acid mutarotase
MFSISSRWTSRWSAAVSALVFLALVCNNLPISAQTAPKPAEWAWMGGSSTQPINGACVPGVYGTLGTFAAANNPGNRQNPVTWTDMSGDLWLFGGYGCNSASSMNYLNDLWEYKTSTGQWAWVGGSSASEVSANSPAYAYGVYGTKGTASTANIPGGRSNATAWMDKSGNFWLFGGIGVEAPGTPGGYYSGLLNDLWKFAPSTKAWTWVSGSNTFGTNGGQASVYGTLGDGAEGNAPGGRYSPVSWVDGNGNFWLFGGEGMGSSTDTPASEQYQLNDLWEFQPSSGEWAWMGGSDSYSANPVIPGVYGTIGVPSANNVPGARLLGTNWTDKSGNFWLFGGSGFDANGGDGALADLWEYNPTSQEWAWMGGSSTLPSDYVVSGIYGMEGVAAAGNLPGGRYGATAWNDDNGNFWLLGGYGYDSSSDDPGYLNDLWAFDPTTKEWTWMAGSSVLGGPENGQGGQNGTYGTLGSAAESNSPGGREDAAGWTDGKGNLWLYGGYGFDGVGTNSQAGEDDLWEYQIASGVTTTPVAPVIESVSAVAAEQTQTITITGSGFGTLAAYTGESPYIGIWDVTQADWSAGYGEDLVGLNVESWTNTQIVLGGYTGSYYGTYWSIAAGDSLTLEIWNANSGNGPAACTGIVVGGAATTCPTSLATVAMPSLSLKAGSYSTAQSLTITDTTPNADIYYTIDGSLPNTTSARYSTALTVSSSETVKAIAVAPGYNNSGIATVAYVFLQAQTITFPAIPSQVVGATVTLAATASSGLPVTYKGTTPAVCTISGSTATMIATGTCSIDVMQSGNASYSAAPAVGTSFVVRESQTITFPAITGTQTVGATVALSASSSSGLTVTFTSTTPAVCSVSGATAKMLATGTCTVQAAQSGNTTYGAAAPVSQSITVGAKEAQTITFPAIPAQVVGATVNLTATASSGLAVTYKATTPAVCTISGSTATMVATGTCSIDVTQAGNASYSAAPAVGTSFVVRESQTITFPAITGTQTVGAKLALSASASSGLTVTFTSTTPAVCSVSGASATMLAIGTCTVQTTQSGNATYGAATPVLQNIVVATKETQTITFPAIPSQVVGATVNLTATASSGLAVTYKATTPAVCTISGSTATMVATGTCSIDVAQAGNASYAAAPAVGTSFVVRQSQTITFPAITGTQTVGAKVALSASASSGLAVTFTSTTPAVCTVSSTTDSLLAGGTCTVVATQAGNATYAAASASQSFTVTKLSQTITFSKVANQTEGATINLVASASSGLAITYKATTPSVCSTSGSTATMLAAGTCSIDFTQSGNTVYAAAQAEGISFFVNP